jgi:hypothetical protein
MFVNNTKHRSMERSGDKWFHCTHVFDLTNQKGEKRRHVGKLNGKIRNWNYKFAICFVICRNMSIQLCEYVFYITRNIFS